MKFKFKNVKGILGLARVFLALSGSIISLFSIIFYTQYAIAPVTTYSTKEFTDYFEYVSIVDTGFKGNYSNISQYALYLASSNPTFNATIYNATIVSNALGIRDKFYCTQDCASENGSSFSKFTLNQSNGRFVNGNLTIDLKNPNFFNPTTIEGIKFRENDTGYAYFLALKKDGNSNVNLTLGYTRNEPDAYHNLIYDSFIGTTSNVSDTTLSIVANNNSMKIYYNGNLTYSGIDYNVSDYGSSNGSISLFYNVTLALTGSGANVVNFDNLLINSTSSITPYYVSNLTYISNNSAYDTSDDWFNVTLTNCDNGCSSTLQINVTSNILSNFTMTSDGSNLFYYRFIGGLPAGIFNVSFFVSSGLFSNNSNIWFQQVHKSTPILGLSQNTTSLLLYNNFNLNSTDFITFNKVLNIKGFDVTGNNENNMFFGFQNFGSSANKRIFNSTSYDGSSSINSFVSGIQYMRYNSSSQLNITNITNGMTMSIKLLIFSSTASLSPQFSCFLAYNNMSVTLTDATNLQTQYCFEKGRSTLNSSNLAMRFAIWNMSESKITSGDVEIPLNRWVTIAGRFNLTHVSIFLDGVERNSSMQQSMNTLIHPITTSNNLQCVGCGSKPQIHLVPEGFLGNLDDLMILNVSLSNDEINASAKGFVVDKIVSSIASNLLNITGWIYVGDTSTILSLYRNETLIDTRINPTNNVSLTYGIYNFTLYYPESQNYTTFNLTKIVYIVKSSWNQTDSLIANSSYKYGNIYSNHLFSSIPIQQNESSRTQFFGYVSRVGGILYNSIEINVTHNGSAFISSDQTNFTNINVTLSTIPAGWIRNLTTWNVYRLNFSGSEYSNITNATFSNNNLIYYSRNLSIQIDTSFNQKWYANASGYRNSWNWFYANLTINNTDVISYSNIFYNISDKINGINSTFLSENTSGNITSMSSNSLFNISTYFGLRPPEVNETNTTTDTTFQKEMNIYVPTGVDEWWYQNRTNNNEYVWINVTVNNSFIPNQYKLFERIDNGWQCIVGNETNLLGCKVLLTDTPNSTSYNFSCNSQISQCQFYVTNFSMHSYLILSTTLTSSSCPAGTTEVNGVCIVPASPATSGGTSSDSSSFNIPGCHIQFDPLYFQSFGRSLNNSFAIRNLGNTTCVGVYNVTQLKGPYHPEYITLNSQSFKVEPNKVEELGFNIDVSRDMMSNNTYSYQICATSLYCSTVSLGEIPMILVFGVIIVIGFFIYTILTSIK